MGNTQCRDAEEFQKNYIHLGRRKDPRYDTVDFYQNRNNLKDFIMVKDRWTNSQQESQEINAMIENRKSIYHPNLAVCQEYQQENQEQWFNNFYKHNMGFEYYDNNLDKLNQQRALQGTPETEEMLWYTAHSLVDADVTLNREGDAYHGDIQPSTVMLTDQSLTPDVKTIDSTLVHLNKGTYDRMLFDRNVKAAVSPEVCSQLEQKKVKPVFDPSKQESWALGMTLLCQSNNTTLDDYYDWKVPRVKFDAVQDGLDNIDRNHSNQFHGFVQDCLNESEDDRKSMEDHEAWLKQYKNQAKDKKLNFKKPVKVHGGLPPKPPVRKPDYTQLIEGEDDFFNQNINVPQQQQTTIKFTGGGFFDVQEQILEDEQGNFFD